MLKQNILVTVDALVFYKNEEHLQLLLVKRKFDPNKGMWAFPGGFVEDDEEIEHAAMRELQEETGLTINGLTQLHTFGKPGRDQRGRTISIIHYTILNEQPPVTGGDDAADAQWVAVKDINAMAFDHMEVLEFALQALKSELM